MHYVYKYVLDDEIIYIGKCNGSLSSRIASHGKPGDNICEDGWNDIQNADIYYCELYNDVMSDVVESELIRRYNPKYNIAKTKTKWGGLPFVEPHWIEYKQKIKDVKQQKTIKKLEKKIDQQDNFIKEILLMCKTCPNKEASDYLYSDKYKRDAMKIDGKDAKEQRDKYGKTAHEIIDLYNNGEENINYLSLAFDRFGIVVCEKRIYTIPYFDKEPLLYFSFFHSGLKRPAKGFLYNKPNGISSNMSTIRQYENKGDNIYYPVNRWSFPESVDVFISEYEEGLRYTASEFQKACKQ